MPRMRPRHSMTLSLGPEIWVTRSDDCGHGSVYTLIWVPVSCGQRLGQVRSGQGHGSVYTLIWVPGTGFQVSKQGQRRAGQTGERGGGNARYTTDTLHRSAYCLLLAMAKTQVITLCYEQPYTFRFNGHVCKTPSDPQERHHPPPPHPSSQPNAPHGAP